jgi:hypothetical protein
MCLVSGIASNGVQLFISDRQLNRVLIYNSFPTQTFQAADRVLGQADFSHTQANDDNQDNVQDAAPTARTLHTPTDLLLVGNKLLVSDSDNHRILVFGQ